MPPINQLLAAQFPQWADLPIKLVDSAAGTDNAIYRLGEGMVIRLPRIVSAIERVEKEQFWLPRFAPLLPLAIPVPIVMGIPSEDYPSHWSIYQWLEGESATIERMADLRQAATALAQFVAAFQRINLTGGPPAGAQNFFHGVPLAMQDPYVRDAIATLHNTLDTDAVTEAWETALQHGLPVWIHGDLRAVIDFGGLGVGDPACDLMIAWELFSAETRDIFRSALQVDDASWIRGRGWALSFGLIALPYYHRSNSMIAASARHAIDEVLADHKRDT